MTQINYIIGDGKSGAFESCFLHTLSAFRGKNNTSIAILSKTIRKFYHRINSDSKEKYYYNISSTNLFRL